MRIYNLGSLNIDYVYSVDHFVSAGETLCADKMDTFPGGKGLNQSVALARAGADVAHGALVGDDGGFLIETMRNSGVDVSKVARVAGNCGHAVIQVNKAGENCIMIYPGTNRQLTRAYVDSFLADAAAGDVLLVQNETNSKGYAMRIAKERGMKIALNPSPFDDSIKNLPLELVDYWFCNEIEGASLFGVSDPDGICKEFLKAYENSALILTLGEEGSVYCSKQKIIKQPAYKAEAVDTTAAGDTFTGYFLSEISVGATVEEALDIASRASAITVSSMGASSSIPYFDDVISLNAVE